MRFEGYSLVGGQHPETAALRNILAYLGVKAPHTAKPFSEAMLLGIGGGIGGGYWIFEYKSLPYPIFNLFTRHGWWEAGAGFLTSLGERLGLTTAVRETGSATVAEKHLTEAVVVGRPAIVWIDLASTPYYFLPADLKGLAPHVVTICGFDEAANQVEIDDRAAVSYIMTRTDLASARRSVTSNKHRLMLVDGPHGEINLERAVAEGIRACCAGLTTVPAGLPAWAGKNCGLSAFAKWADLIADPKDKRGWPNLFTRGRRLYRGLVNIFRQIETNGTGGGAFRLMYADFLREAADALSRPNWRALGDQYHEIGQMWRACAYAALPESVQPLRQTRDILLQQHRIFQERGANGLEEIRKLDQQLSRIETEVSQDFPLGESEARDLLIDLRDHLRRICRAESQAVEALRDSVT